MSSLVIGYVALRIVEWGITKAYKFFQDE